MVDRVIYDTGNSEVLANNFWADGENEYNAGKALELYIDKEGRYFFAEYSSWEGAKNRICPVSAEDAAAFMEKRKTDDAYLVTGNTKHFPIEQFVVTPREMLAIIYGDIASPTSNQ